MQPSVTTSRLRNFPFSQARPVKRAHPTRTPRAPRARPAAPGALASPALDTPVRGRATRGVCPSASGWFRLAHVFETRPHCRVCPTVMPSHGRIAPIRLWTGPWVLRLRAAVNGAAADRAGRCLRPFGWAPGRGTLRPAVALCSAAGGDARPVPTPVSAFSCPPPSSARGASVLAHAPCFPSVGPSGREARTRV